MNYKNTKLNRSCIHHSMGFMDSDRCPYCGAPNTKGMWTNRVINLTLFLFIVISFLAIFRMLYYR